MKYITYRQKEPLRYINGLKTLKEKVESYLKIYLF